MERAKKMAVDYLAYQASCLGDYVAEVEAGLKDEGVSVMERNGEVLASCIRTFGLIRDAS